MLAYLDLGLGSAISKAILRKMNENHDERGRFATGDGVSASAASDLAHQALSGGFSYNPTTHSAPASGYMVARVGSTVSVPAGSLNEAANGLREFISGNIDAFRADPNLHIGGWVSEGRLWIEPADNVASAEQATRLGMARDQKAIWDVVAGTEIDTGGSGGANAKTGSNDPNYTSKALRQDSRGLGDDESGRAKGLGQGISYAIWDVFRGESGYKLKSLEVETITGCKDRLDLTKIMPSEVINTLAILRKQNDNHDERGRFASSDGSGAAATDYRGSHEAPTRSNDFGSPATDITEMMPDFYEHPQWYTTGMASADKESLYALRSIKDNPNASVTVYRGVPTDVKQINAGDWVTMSRSYAESHIASNVESGHVVSQQIQAKDLWFDGNSINEFGYDPVMAKALFLKYSGRKSASGNVELSDLTPKQMVSTAFLQYTKSEDGFVVKALDAQTVTNCNTRYDAMAQLRKEVLKTISVGNVHQNATNWSVRDLRKDFTKATAEDSVETLATKHDALHDQADEDVTRAVALLHHVITSTASDLGSPIECAGGALSQPVVLDHKADVDINEAISSGMISEADGKQAIDDGVNRADIVTLMDGDGHYVVIIPADEPSDIAKALGLREDYRMVITGLDFVKADRPKILTEVVDDGKPDQFTLAPYYIPNKLDGHDEWVETRDLDKAVNEWSLLAPNRNVFLQHNEDIVAGTWTQLIVMPWEFDAEMRQHDGTVKKVHFPKGTVLIGVVWKNWAWEMILDGRITGMSMGGMAKEKSEDIPPTEET